MATGCIDTCLSVNSDPHTRSASGFDAQASVWLPAARGARGLANPVLHGLESLRGAIRGQAVIFGLCCLFVAAVSVHDAALVVVNHEVIADVEQNPMGQWLLDVQDGGVWLFVLLKLAGTALVCAVVVTLYQRHTQYGMVTAGGLVVFQAALLGYLTLV
jgi:hypothetical protein